MSCFSLVFFLSLFSAHLFLSLYLFSFFLSSPRIDARYRRRMPLISYRDNASPWRVRTIILFSRFILFSLTRFSLSNDPIWYSRRDLYSHKIKCAKSKEKQECLNKITFFMFIRQNETFFSNYMLHMITQINLYDSIYLSIQ